MAHHVNRGSNLGVEGGVAIAVTAHHLSHFDTLRVTDKARGDAPALEGGLKHGLGHRVEVVEDPYRVPTAFVGFASYICHCLILLYRILYLNQVHRPTL